MLCVGCGGQGWMTQSVVRTNAIDLVLRPRRMPMIEQGTTFGREVRALCKELPVYPESLVG